MTTDREREIAEVVDLGLRAAAGALAYVLAQCDPQARVLVWRDAFLPMIGGYLIGSVGTNIALELVAEMPDVMRAAEPPPTGVH